MTAHSNRLWRFWIPAFLWMGIIFFLSSDFFSSEQTSPLLEILLRFFFPDLSKESLDVLHQITRKTAHMAVYAFLSLFYVQGLARRFRVMEAWNLRLGFWAVALSILYALSDEWHQSFSPNRTGSLYDVGWDAVGAALAQLFLGLVRLSRQPLLKDERS